LQARALARPHLAPPANSENINCRRRDAALIKSFIITGDLQCAAWELLSLRANGAKVLPNNINRRAKETFIIRIIMKEKSTQAQNKRETHAHSSLSFGMSVRFASACFIFTLNLRTGIFSLQLIARAWSYLKIKRGS
jgi:hypothetical protein